STKIGNQRAWPRFLFDCFHHPDRSLSRLASRAACSAQTAVRSLISRTKPIRCTATSGQSGQSQKYSDSVSSCPLIVVRIVILGTVTNFAVSLGRSIAWGRRTQGDSANASGGGPAGGDRGPPQYRSINH